MLKAEDRTMEASRVFVVAKNNARREVLVRIASTFLEQPGLRLTLSQAERLWDLDRAVCGQHLKELIDAEFLEVRNEHYQLRVG